MPSSPKPSSVFQNAISNHLAVIRRLDGQLATLERIGIAMSGALKEGKKVLWCGNGGSAADCQHLAAELVGRFRLERRGLSSIALTTDTSILTSIGNDYGYEKVFQRQVEALGNSGDIVVGISTSGNSRNVCDALAMARKLGAITVAFTGASGGEIVTLADMVLQVDSLDTARIQEGHILCGHMLCDWIELSVCAPANVAISIAAS